MKAEDSDLSAITGIGMNNMLLRNGGQAFVLGMILMFFGASTDAQQTVYKWVDEDGVVHFGDAPPDESVSPEVKTLITTPAPTNVPTAQPAVSAPAVPDVDAQKQSAQPEIESPPLVANVDITKMSLEDLDRRCDDAREMMIAPLREAEIASCKQNKRNDPEWCERFNVDFGDGGRTVSGSIRPRMFDDLRECVDAQQERNRRRR